MEYIYSFSSRNSAMRFCDAVVSFGGYAKLVNSPIEQGAGCGLAVKCKDNEMCDGVLNRGYYVGLRAVYEYDGVNYTTLYNCGS